MKMKRGLTLILIGVFLLQLISANTEITLNTISYYKVDIRTLNPDDNSVIESFYKTSDKDGKVVVSSTAANSFKVAVWIYEEKRGPENIIKYEVSEESYSPGISVNLEVYPDGYVVPETEENLTTNETTETTNETVASETQNQGTITGAVPGILSGNNLLYFGAGLLGLLVIIGVVVFIILKKKKQRYHSYGFKKQDWNSYKKDKDDNFYKSKSQQKEEFDEDYPTEDELEEAERKIREAQDTIKRLKNQDRIKELKSKLNQDKEKLIQDEHELMRLRGGKLPKDNNPNRRNPNKGNRNFQ